LGRASRGKHERRNGRTVRLQNEDTGIVEVFHGVTVSDQAIVHWLSDREISVAAGYPNRPPDVDTLHLRRWIKRPGDPVGFYARPAWMNVTRLLGFWSRPFLVRWRADRDDQGIFVMSHRSSPLRGTLKAAVERYGQSFRASYRVIVQGEGVIMEGETFHESEGEARAWLLEAFESLPGSPDEPTYLDPDEMRRESDEIWA
jgi:hypothetical protein